MAPLGPAIDFKSRLVPFWSGAEKAGIFSPILGPVLTAPIAVEKLNRTVAVSFRMEVGAIKSLDTNK